jgi:protein SCO1/2
MSHASTLAPTKAPLSWSALAWKTTLVLIPLLTAAILFFLRQSQVARLASHALPKDGLVPWFQLTDQNGAPFGSPELLGKIWIVCYHLSRSLPDDCNRMGDCKSHPIIDAEAGLVRYRTDTPAVLRDYAAKLDAQPGRWYFLTGDKGTIYRLSRDGFKLAAEEGEAVGPIHSTRMVLVDRSGTIRGYYDATDADAVTRLLADVAHLRREKP